MRASAPPDALTAQVEAADRTIPAVGTSAALDPDLASALGIRPGDLMRVGTSARSLVIRVEVPEELAGTGQALLDTLTRRVLMARLGEDIEIGRAEGQTIGRLRLDVDERAGDAEAIAPRIRGELLRGSIALSVGSVVALPVGAEGSLVVVRVSESDADGIVDAETAITADLADLGEFLRPATGGLEEVGGNARAVDELREVVQLAISHPEVYSRLGIRPSRGVILQGPPGTGKSLLCRSLAGEIDAAFYYISGPEVVGTLHGQTEEGLRAVFADAVDHAPAIICIDEVDALTRNRRALSSQADLRAVAQLLALMDGLRRAPGVFVVGTTNRVDLIDPAFRRPGRFDREVVMAEPNERERLEILQVHTRAMPLSATARGFLAELARDTVGFTGADLWALAQRAGLSALRRTAHRGGISAAGRRLASLETIGVEDLRAATDVVKPSSVRDGHVVIPKQVELVGKTPALDRLRALAEKVPAGVVLSGASGSGKTAMVHALAAEQERRLIVVNGPELASRWLGDTEEAVRHLGELARRVAPSVLLFEHLEAMAPRTSGTVGTEARLTGQLAAVISELSDDTDVFVVGTAVDPDAVDPTVLGATGLRVRVHIDEPDHEDIRALLASFLDRHGVALGTRIDDADLDAAAHQAAGLAPADLRTAVALAADTSGTGGDLAHALQTEIAGLAAR